MLFKRKDQAADLWGSSKNQKSVILSEAKNLLSE